MIMAIFLSACYPYILVADTNGSDIDTMPSASNTTQPTEQTEKYRIMLQTLNGCSGEDCNAFWDCYGIRDRESYQDYIAPEYATITINGQTLEGKLKKTWWYSAIPEFIYYNDAEEVAFCYNALGQVTHFSFWSPEKLVNTEKIATAEDCLNAAKDYLSEIVNIADYTIVIEQKAIIGTDHYGYRINFLKYVDGIVSNDSAHFLFSPDGQILSYTANNIGKISVDMVNPFDLTIVQELLFEAGRKRHADSIANGWNVWFEDPDFTFTI